MSTVANAGQLTTAEPRRPWAVSRSKRLLGFGRMLTFAVAAFVATILTPLANFDGWAVAFLLINLAWVIGIASKLGAKERRDAVLRVVIT